MSPEEKVRDVIAEQLEADIEEVTNDAFLTDDLRADPYDLEAIADQLSDEFEIEIAEEDIESWERVEDVVNMVLEKLEE